MSFQTNCRIEREVLFVDPPPLPAFVMATMPRIDNDRAEIVSARNQRKRQSEQSYNESTLHDAEPKIIKIC
jgi:hypothetical protein